MDNTVILYFYFREYYRDKTILINAMRLSTRLACKPGDSV